VHYNFGKISKRVAAGQRSIKKKAIQRKAIAASAVAFPRVLVTLVAALVRSSSMMNCLPEHIFWAVGMKRYEYRLW